MELLGGSMQGLTGFYQIRDRAGQAEKAVDNLAASAAKIEALGTAADNAAEGFDRLRKAADVRPNTSAWLDLGRLLDALTESLVAAASMALRAVFTMVNFTLSTVVEVIKMVLINLNQLGLAIASVVEIMGGIGSFDNSKIKAGLANLSAAFKKMTFFPNQAEIESRLWREIGGAWTNFVDKINRTGIKLTTGVDIDFSRLRQVEAEIQKWKVDLNSKLQKAPFEWNVPVQLDWSKLSPVVPTVVTAMRFSPPQLTIPVQVEMELLGSGSQGTFAQRLIAQEDTLSDRLTGDLRDRLAGMQRLESMHYQARLAAADEFDRTRFRSSATFSRQALEAERQYREQLLELDRWYQEQAAAFPAQASLLAREVQQGRLDLEATYAEQRAQIARAEQEQLVNDWLQAHETMIQASNEFTSYWIENAIRGGGTWREALAQVGEAIMSSLAGKALSALWNFIATSATATAAQTTLAATTTAATTATAAFTAASSSATAAQTALAVATGATATTTGVLTAASVAATTAQTIETASVVALTGSYVALAAAKEAAAAAGGEGAGGGGGGGGFNLLVGLATGNPFDIITGIGGFFGFDDPANDAVAFRHGRDYMREFMSGAKSRAMAPAFGLEVNAMLAQAAGDQQQVAPKQDMQTMIVHNHFEGVVSEDFQRETIQLTGRASRRRQVKLYSVTDPRFGGSLALGGI